MFIGISSAQTIDTIKKSDFNTEILIRIDSEKIDFLSDNFEIVGSNPGVSFDLIIKRENLENSKLSEGDYSILIDDVGLYDQSVASDYHTFPEIESFLNDISNSYPNITCLSSIGKSYQNRDLWLIEISDNPGIDEDEPGVFFMGLHHAREWPTVEICLYIIEQLTSSYESDPDIKNIVDNRRILILPCVNPDGYVYSHDIGYDWRKNRHEFPEFSSVGVDLNRNYAGSSNGDPLGSWGSISGSVSNNPSSEVYCGPGSISELETRAVKNIFLNYDLCTSISWHTYSELVLWPWGYSTQKVTPDNEYMSQVGTNIASKIETQEGYGLYDPMQSSNLYPTTGDTTDWAYGYYHYVLGKPMFAYTIEACSSFHPSSSKLEQICQENFDGAIYLLNEAENINNIVPRVMPPTINQIEIESENNIKINWEETNIKADPTLFKLQELSDLDILLDDVEKVTDNWILNGFTVSDSYSKSGRYSYYGSNKQGKVFTMTSKYPIHINDDMDLSFWCKYDVDYNENFAYLEISKEGRYYEILDSLTDCSNGWIKKEYNLDDYVGKSIYIRFRVSGESFDMGSDGFYFDDIYPVADFDHEKIVSDDIITKYYEINNKEDGTYFYRVSGFNEKYGWGDYSCLKKVLIGNKAPEKPDKPIGDSSGKPGDVIEFYTSTIDPEGDDVYYMFDWGDGTKSDWIGPFESGVEISKSYSWDKKGLYLVRVKAKDIYDSESEWSDPYEISMPKTKQTSFLRLLIFRILNILKEFYNFY